ncbi:hypothetical protein BP6252_11869 [Coleophoma cylindrospora]|uniref:Zn(2)-C6 fungal-type domain-containing protein n=1 Tax=Coleophoma cylindrospora TaxID=1849047 RepID=A0A3D8QKT0_9HELO|nr:hypothetical protein BP6252_11869 [Coleophoma cylindrospora]
MAQEAGTKDLVDGREPRRAAPSCSECQRRKQKCSREWPCNHCRGRRVQHLCEYKSNKAAVGDAPSSSESNLKRGRMHDTTVQLTLSTPGESSVVAGQWDDAGDDTLEAMGYMVGHHHFNLGTALENVRHKPPNDLQNQGLEELKSTLREIPTRSLTVSPEFTCLLLRVCACSTQYLEPAMEEKLEFELAESIQSLTQRYHSAAEKLTRSLSGAGDCTQIQQLFLGVCWLKSESKFVDAWHALGATIRAAQEIGMHEDVVSKSLSDFENEMRRRLWCLLYVFDWQMSHTLSRPFIIDHRSCSFVMPSLNIEASNAQPELPSPFTHISFLCELLHSLSTEFDAKLGATTYEHSIRMHNKVEKWIAKLPPVYSMNQPDTCWDDEHPYIVQQRLQLHAILYLVEIDLLKPYLTKSVKLFDLEHEDELVALGINCCLKLLEVSYQLLDVESPVNGKSHNVIFPLFDTAAILCSAMLHATSYSLPQCQRVVEEVKKTLCLLSKLSLLGQTASMSYSLLSKIAAAVPLLQGVLLSSDRPAKRIKVLRSPKSCQINNVTSTNPLSGSDVEITPSLSNTDTWQSTTSEDNWAPELGGLEQIWDWETLNLDFSALEDE